MSGAIGMAADRDSRLDAQARPVSSYQEESVGTAAWQSLHCRHVWLQMNLLSSFLAAGVIGLFEDTLVQVIAVAAFVPVMVGQSASTGAQALAVALRGLSRREQGHDRWRDLLQKEVTVGIGNGTLVGVTSACGIYVYAVLRGHPGAGLLAMVMLLAMIVSTVVSSIVGAVMPLLMHRLGMDPAASATIVVGGVTRLVSIGAFLVLTHWICM